MELLQQAEGMLRCGSCLNIFDGFREESQFVAPQIPDEDEQTPLGQLSVQAMDSVEMPSEPAPTPWLGIALSAALAALLLAQVTWKMLSPPSAESVSLQQLVIRAHPQYQSALRLDALLHNDAYTAQSFPDLLVSFRDEFGQIQIQRRFEAGEYLHGELSGESSMPGRSSVQVSLSMQDPGRSALNYQARLLFDTANKN